MDMTSRYTRKASLALSLGLCGAVLIGLSQSSSAQTFTQSGAGSLLRNPDQAYQLQEERNEEQYRVSPRRMVPDSNLDYQAPESRVTLASSQFFVNSIVVENVTLISKPEVEALIRPYTGRNITIDELKQLVEAINKKYWDKGYVTTQAIVPQQDVSTGTVHLQVVEGRLGSVAITGNKYNRTSAILARLGLKEGTSFNIRDLEKTLTTSNLNYDYQIKAKLSPGENTGETNVTLEVSETQPWQITPSVDNGGRPYIGYYRGGVQVSNNSVFGLNDRFNAQFLGNDKTQIAATSYSVPIGAKGGELTGTYSYSRVKPELPGVVNQPDIKGTSHNVGITYSHPLDKQRHWVADVSLGARTIRNEIDGIGDPDSDADIRSLSYGISYNNFDRLGRTFARVQSTHGVGLLGGDRKFWKMEGYLTRLFQVTPSNTLIVRGYGMYSPDNLPPAEQIQIGGATSVRGYTEGVLLGDKGFTLSVEDRFPLPFISKDSKWRQRLQGAVFADAGYVSLNNNSPFLLPNGKDNLFIASVGMGLRAQLTQYLQGFVDVGVGLVNGVEPFGVGEPTARIHFGIRSDLLDTSLRPRRDDVTTIPIVNNRR